MHVVATAGHVDHGKSTLVRALTGMEPDRWAEEKRRGLTIDLGYAWTSLPTGEEIAFVDVPGHERFIVNMLAGIGPVASVLFVVAADAGWSRQSEEHLRAIDALGVRHGLLAVTRSDLADPAHAIDEARTRIAATSLGEVDAVAVSGSTGTGLDELRAALATMVASVPPPDLDADVRLWLDRAFTVRGSGTVVTATLSAGRVSVGDRLELHGEPVTVRGIESLGATRDCVEAPARVALNLRGVARETVARGDTLLAPRSWLVTSVLDVRTDVAEQVEGELMLHVGTSAVAAHVRPLGANTARVSLATALPLRAGDRAVLRDPGRQSVVCGLEVLDAEPPALDRRGAARRRGEELVGGRPTAYAEVARRGFVTRAHLHRLGITPGDGLLELGGRLVTPEHWEHCVAAARDVATAWASDHALDPTMPLAALRQSVAVPDDDAVVTALVDAAGLVRDGGGVRAPGRAASLSAGVATLVRRMENDLFAAPERDELSALRLDRRELAAAERAGALVRVGADIVLLPHAIDRAVELLGALPPTFTTSQARQALGTTRRVVIPLLEHLDRLGHTERVDASTRRVTPG